MAAGAAHGPDEEAGRDARAYHKRLLQEHKDYYRAGHLAPSTGFDAKEQAAIAMRARKAWYHARAKAKKASGSGALLGGKTLVYQAAFPSPGA